ncbi:MAG: hypothetical protein H6825_09850 [Planctomycetes bacterium]|nr:hypothetical protein [Planctomycetota bacterium]
MSDRNPSKATVWLTAVVLVLGMTSSGCSFNNHLTFGATEKWVASDIHTIPKVGGTIFLSIFDSILSPWFMIGDEFRSERYHPDHKYLTYAGSRAIGRSGMPLGYQFIASIFSIPIETAYLPITGLVDLVRVIWVDDVPVPASAHGGKPKAGF